MADAAAAKLAPQATIYSNQNQNQSSSSSSSSYNASEGAGADGAGMQVDAAAIEGAGMYKS